MSLSRWRNNKMLHEATQVLLCVILRHLTHAALVELRESRQTCQGRALLQILQRARPTETCALCSRYACEEGHKSRLCRTRSPSFGAGCCWISTSTCRICLSRKEKPSLRQTHVTFVQCLSCLLLPNFAAESTAVCYIQSPSSEWQSTRG